MVELCLRLKWTPGGKFETRFYTYGGYSSYSFMSSNESAERTSNFLGGRFFNDWDLLIISCFQEEGEKPGLLLDRP